MSLYIIVILPFPIFNTCTHKLIGKIPNVSGCSYLYVNLMNCFQWCFLSE